MESLVASLLWLLAILLGIMMLRQGLSRRVDFFSVRNLYLVGFIVYQVVSPSKSLFSGFYPFFRIDNPAAAAKLFLLYAYVYVGVFLLSYHRLRITRWLASKLSGIPAVAPDSMLIGMALVLVLVGVPLRLYGGYVPAAGATLVNISIAMAAIACAIAGWVWGHRRFNIAVIWIVALILGASLVITLYGAFGRRPLIGMLLGFAWGAYHRWARQLRPAKLIIHTIPIAIAAILVVSAFTAIRGQVKESSNVQVTLGQMRQANVKVGVVDVFSGQTCGAASLWALEKYPSQIRPNHLFSLKYMFQYYVPRIWWPEKPMPLSKHTARLARIKGVRWDVITIPPGVIGYAAAEGGFYALIIYAIFFGQFTRFFDELVRMNPANPFIILPVGCAIGQFLGLARGDIAVFVNVTIVSFVSTFILMWLAKRLFGGRSHMPYPAPWPQPR